MKSWLAALVLVLISLDGIATDYPPVTVDMKLKQVSEHVYYVRGVPGIATDNQGFISNAAAVITPEGIIVVDALGSPSLAARFLTLLREVSDQPIKQVILTHYHADHIYGIQVFKELGAKIVAPAGYAEYLHSEYAQQRLAERRESLSPWVNEQTRLVAPDQVVDKDYQFSLGGIELAVKFFGAAHSDGDLALLVKSDGVLLSGDLIFEGRVPFTGNADTGHWLSALRELNEAKLQGLVPGHGPAAKKPREAVALTLNYLQYVRDKMAEAVEEMMPFAEAYEATDWSAFSDLPAFQATHRRNAYGVYLSLEEEQFK
ncbi:MAG: MBL fold metallo-hydrolase [Chromatiales bacterium]|nr:MBL fold metallo-hydrolase [Chromatiales bacterium]